MKIPRYSAPIAGAVMALVVLLRVVAGSSSSKNADAGQNKKPVSILNVSYDPTRELYREYNEQFAAYYQKKTGEAVIVNQSHGGSGNQARSVIEGKEADVVTLALAYDIDAIVNARHIISPDWITRFPHNSAPYTSTIVFLVRSGNPKNIKDWDDLIKPGVEIVTPDPKSSGGARWNYLAAWAYARKKNGDQKHARAFVTKLFANVVRLDAGARGSTNTFVKDGVGDVLLAWENEAYLAINEMGPEKFEIVTPSLSILAEPSVTYVDANVEAHNTRLVAISYLDYLYSKEGQRIAGKHYYRPSDPAVMKEFANRFQTLNLITIDHEFGGWGVAQKTHFSDGGVFDQIMESIKKK